jgi:hypothetical protein
MAVQDPNSPAQVPEAWLTIRKKVASDDAISLFVFLIIFNCGWWYGVFSMGSSIYQSVGLVLEQQEAEAVIWLIQPKTTGDETYYRAFGAFKNTRGDSSYFIQRVDYGRFRVGNRVTVYYQESDPENLALGTAPSLWSFATELFIATIMALFGLIPLAILFDCMEKLINKITLKRKLKRLRKSISPIFIPLEKLKVYYDKSYRQCKVTLELQYQGVDLEGSEFTLSEEEFANFKAWVDAGRIRVPIYEDANTPGSYLPDLKNIQFNG